jgi:hypothetical protein
LAESIEIPALELAEGMTLNGNKTAWGFHVRLLPGIDVSN